MADLLTVYPEDVTDNLKLIDVPLLMMAGSAPHRDLLEAGICRTGNHEAEGIFREAANDPELEEMMNKYIYGDSSRQIKLTDTERQLVTIVVLATNQNHKLLKRVTEGALALDVNRSDSST